MTKKKGINIRPMTDAERQEAKSRMQKIRQQIEDFGTAADLFDRQDKAAAAASIKETTPDPHKKWGSSKTSRGHGMDR